MLLLERPQTGELLEGRFEDLHHLRFGWLNPLHPFRVLPVLDIGHVVVVDASHGKSAAAREKETTNEFPAPASPRPSLSKSPSPGTSSNCNVSTSGPVVQGEGMRLFACFGGRRDGLLDGGGQIPRRLHPAARPWALGDELRAARAAPPLRFGPAWREARRNLLLGNAREQAGRGACDRRRPRPRSPPDAVFVWRSSPYGPYGDADVQQASRTLDMLGGDDRQPALRVQGASASRVIQDGQECSVDALLARCVGLQRCQGSIVIRALLRADALRHLVAHHDLARLVLERQGRLRLRGEELRNSLSPILDVLRWI